MLDYAQVPNLPTLFFDQVERYGATPFLWAKKNGDWQPLTWTETSDLVCRFAAGLAKRGIGSGDRVVLVSENRPEWMIADLAIMAVGAVTVPAYTTNTVADHRHILSDSGARAAIISNKTIASRFMPAAEECGLEFVIGMNGYAPEASGAVRAEHWPDVLESDGRDAVRQNAAKLERGSMCCIIYTSGTGGTPAGVMLSHGNIICNALSAEDMLVRLPGFEFGKEIFLSFLPLSHSYEHTTGQFVPISIGAQVYYAEGLDKLVQNIGEVRPTIMTAVPRLYETMRGRILRGAEQAGGLKEKMLYKTIDVGRRRYLGRVLPVARRPGDRSGLDQAGPVQGGRTVRRPAEGVCFRRRAA